jgi:hypothetical protein
MYSSPEIRGEVLDADTGAPVPKVIVVGLWIMSPTVIGSSDYNKRLNLIEVATDEAGTFVLPAWGPKLVPLGETIDGTNPRLAVFKHGYRTEWLLNMPSWLERPKTDPPRTYWTIKLEPFTGTLEQEAFNCSAFYERLIPEIDDPDDQEDWKHYPLTTAAVEKEMQQLESRGLKPGHRPYRLPRIELLSPSDRELLTRSVHD